MTGDREIAESRANALLKEYAITEEQERAARITLAAVALAIPGGPESLRDVLEAAGLAEYDRTLPPKRISDSPYISYERPGK